jgi:hypothetical protein
MWSRISPEHSGIAHERSSVAAISMFVIPSGLSAVDTHNIVGYIRNNSTDIHHVQKEE